MMTDDPDKITRRIKVGDRGYAYTDQYGWMTDEGHRCRDTESAMLEEIDRLQTGSGLDGTCIMLLEMKVERLEAEITKLATNNINAAKELDTAVAAHLDAQNKAWALQERLELESGWGTTKKCGTCHYGQQVGARTYECDHFAWAPEYDADWFCADWRPKKDGG